MRKMKDSGIEWIGQIPQEWDVRKIKHCFNVYAGATPKSGNSEFWDGDIVWVTPADYTTEQKYVSEGRKSITSEGFESCSTEMIPARSLIFSKRAPIGLVAINTVDLCTNQGCLSCVPLDKNDVEYFYYAFSSFTEQFDLYGSGTTFKEISADAFVNFPIPCPTIETQRNISEYLRNRCAEIDALIAAKEKTNTLLKERRQSIIYEAVTKGLNPDAPMKDSGIEWIGSIPNHWTVSRLKFCSKIDSGEMISKDEFDEHGQFAVIGSNGEIGRTNKCNNQTPVITTGRVGTVGTVQIVSNAWVTDNALIINPQVNINYLKHIIPNFDFDAMLSGTAQPLITATKLANQHIPMPSETEQDRIANYLDKKCAEVDALISANEATIHKLKEYRQSVIYEAVTGKIEV